MNWEAIGAIGQMLGSTAVFVTLGYLAIQVRHARSETTRQISQGRLRTVREMFVSRISNDDLCDAYLKSEGQTRDGLVAALGHQFGLTPREAMKLFFDQWAWWTFYMENIPYIDQIPASERAVFDASIKAVYQSGTVARVWYDQNRIRGALGDDHVRYVDNLLAQPG